VKTKAKAKSKSALEGAASRLRSIALAAKEGVLVGSEETLIAKSGVSRATVRQAARLLEREGFLRVRRGINGGYFAARPDVRTIEKTVSAYLEMVHTKPEDITVIASVLWVEELRRAAQMKTPEAAMLAARRSRNEWHRRLWNHDTP
jgi:GntR family transcriptional regulator, transcriptional repressor for pyruvate dehydrogenase complex